MAKPYPRQHSSTWFLKRWPYRIFMLRELSAVFLAAFVALLLVLVSRVHAGQAALQRYIDAANGSAMLFFLLVVLAFAVLHTVTWFQAAPKALRLRRGEEPVTPALIIGAQVVAWLGTSVIILGIFLI